MRGKLLHLHGAAQTVGITPADAGKTRGCAEFRQSGWDHPRRCGENSRSIGTAQVLPGSPPQMRGKRYPAVDTGRHHGITPADAGKTSFQFMRRTMTGDHPRRCGENHEQPVSSACAVGSPPQMRGKLSPVVSPARVTGITPADAGKTAIPQLIQAGITGSPPQMRGKPPCEQCGGV